MSKSDTPVKEQLRRVISTDGHELRLTNVTSINNTGSWTRLESDQGYVIINPANVLAFIIKGERAF